jgi:tetratricopeptide (TPR) repeat protein
MELAANNLEQASFRLFREQFLQQREEAFSALDDKTLAGTLALYKRIRQRLTSPARALLDRMVFLNPDSMQEIIFKQIYHANPNTVPHALTELKRASLVQPTAESGVWRMQRLVQEAVKYQMSPENRAACATQTIQALEKLLPPPTSDDWRKIEPLLGHAFVIAEAVGRYHIRSMEAGRLLQRAYLYLFRSELHPGAFLLLGKLQENQQALGIDQATMQALVEEALSGVSPDLARTLNETARAYFNQGRYGEAESRFVRALAIEEKALGPEHPSTAQSLNNLAELYRAQGRLSEAEPLYLRALAIREKALRSEHPDIAQSFNKLAELYRVQGRLSEAEPLYLRALAITEKALGGEHPYTAISLNNLALLCKYQGRHSEAEALHLRTLAIREKALGPEHPSTAHSLGNLADLYRAQGRLSEAEPLLIRALAITGKALGGEHPDTATSLNNLALLYRDQGRLSEAEPLYLRALAITEKALGGEHPDTAISLNNLALLYKDQGRLQEALPLAERAVAIGDKTLGPEHPSTMNFRSSAFGIRIALIEEVPPDKE